MHGFRSQRSCETQLAQFVHNIVSNLDGAVNRGHKQTDLIIMDFAKAFDKVPHRRLLHKLCDPWDMHLTGRRRRRRIGLLWDKRVHPQVDQLMALWAHSKSSVRWSSLSSSPSIIRCTPRISCRTDPVPYFYKRPAG